MINLGTQKNHRNVMILLSTNMISFGLVLKELYCGERTHIPPPLYADNNLEHTIHLSASIANMATDPILSPRGW